MLPDGHEYCRRTSYEDEGTASPVANDFHLDWNKHRLMGVEEVFRQTPSERRQPCFHCFLDVELALGYLAWVVNDGEEMHIGVGGYGARFHPLQALKCFRARVATLLDQEEAILSICGCDDVSF